MSKFDTEANTERASDQIYDEWELQRRYVAGSDEPIDVAVIYAIANVAGIDPQDVDTTLYDAIDPDALEALLADADPDTRVGFELGAYDVVVTGRREVIVTAS